MLLGPIFLALGSVATSLLNAQGRFAAAALAPIVYNLAIIGAAVLLAPSMGVTGLAIGVVAGSIGHLLVQLPAVLRLGFRYTRRIDLADPQARKALALMAPRAIGLGATQITFVVVTSIASTHGDRRDQCLQHRVHAAPDPDRRDRRAARGRRVPGPVAGGRPGPGGGVRRPPVARGPPPAVRHAADHRDRDRPPARSRRSCSSGTASSMPRRST